MAFVYKDQENNIRPMTRLASSILNQKVEKQLQQCKRSVLGEINVDTAKVSSSRYKKQEITKKVKQKFNTFAVYEDSEEPTKDEILEQEYQSANESPSKRFKDDLSAVLDLPSKFISADLQTRQPLQDVLDSPGTSDDGNLSGESYTESPMSIDRTISPIERPKSSERKLFDCETYSDDILAYLMKIEKLHRPKPYYMRRQPEISYSMRTILVDWLVEVAQEYKLHTETLFLAVSFIDRFLSVMSVVKSKLQLLGTSAMFIASKYEEIYPPQVSDFVFITDDTYTIKQVLRMEYLILRVLAFDVSGPTVITFMKHFAMRCKIPDRTVHLATYLSELVLLEGDPYLGFTHSLIAAATILMARYVLGGHTELWPENFVKVTGYRIEDLATCVKHLNETHQNAKKITVDAVNIKYNSNEFMRVASIEPKYLDLRQYVLQTTHMDPFGIHSL